MKRISEQSSSTAKARIGVRVITWSMFALIFIIVFVGYRVSRSQYTAIADRADEITQLRSTVHARELEYNALKELVAQYDAITRSDIARLENIVPNGEDVPSLYVQLQAIAEQHGFLINSITINPGNGENDSGLHSLSITMTMLGPDYEEFKRFLATIESNLRLFDIASVFFNPDVNSYSLSLTAYYYAE